MAETLTHRGPDEGGEFIAGGVGLGFRRLSIIDLSGGNQPHSAADMIHSVCNGEIYNYKELRSALQAKGHSFKTHCDVEVVPHLYREHGCDFVSRLNGQFAFAVYDAEKHELMLARDHVGIAPLFYTEIEGALLFASEIKALLAHPGVRKEVNLTALDQVLTFPGPVSPDTLFKGVYSLRPGHFLSVKSGGYREHCYWDLDYPLAADAGSGDEEQLSADVEAALLKAVDYRLQADVPVGFYLSGGMDSSLIAALIHDLAPDNHRHSFSILFDDVAIDERKYQRIMSEAVGSVHHEIHFGWEDIEKQMPRVIGLTETALKETYDTCSFVLSRLVRDNNIKVVQTGEGADEIFAGYVGYRLDLERQKSGGGFPDAEEMLEAEMRERLWGDPDFIYERNFFAFQETKEALYHHDLAAALDSFTCTNRPLIDVSKLKGRHITHKRSYLDFKLRLSDHLLSDHGDRMAYGNSVEARYPFLDINVIDTARRIPPAMLLKGGVEKYLLRKVARKYLPSAVLDREKFSFVAPGSPYLLGRGIEWVEEILAPETIRRQGYFNPETVERLRAMYAQPGFKVNQTFDNDLLMIVLTFGLFLKQFQMPDRV
jgi:asparagine synthase (glutamine-hydrolysing)